MGNVYSVCAGNVVVGCAFASGDAYTATSPPFVIALRSGADAYVAEMPELFSAAVVGGGFGDACSESSRVATNTPAAATIRRTTRKAPRTTRRRCWRRLRSSVRSVRGEVSSAMRTRVYRSASGR